jgi:hypothetical protein
MSDRDRSPIDPVIREMRVLLNLVKEYELAMEALTRRKTTQGSRAAAALNSRHRRETGKDQLAASVRRLDEMTAA